jgi:hypothetical protein
MLHFTAQTSTLLNTLQCQEELQTITPSHVGRSIWWWSDGTTGLGRAPVGVTFSTIMMRGARLWPAL